MLMPTYRESLICFTFSDLVSYARNRPKTRISPLNPYMTPKSQGAFSVKDIQRIISRCSAATSSLLTQPDGIVLALAVLHLGSQFHVVHIGQGILQRKRLQSTLQRIVDLPREQNHQVHAEQPRDHCVQLPGFHLLLLCRTYKRRISEISGGK